MILSKQIALHSSHFVPGKGFIPSLPSPGPWLEKVLASPSPPQTLTLRIGWGLALGAHKPGKTYQHSCNIPPYSLKILIPTQFWHFWGSKWPPSWAQVGQYRGPFWAQVSKIRWGLALGAHKPAKIGQHSCNISAHSLKMQIPT